MNAIVNVGLLLARISAKGCHGFSEAAAICRTSPNNFKKLARGEIPRLDALQRICRGLDISESQLIVGMAKIRSAEAAKVVELKKSV
jgi:transcriptional regulator with XRE-family HTH domain